MLRRSFACLLTTLGISLAALSVQAANPVELPEFRIPSALTITGASSNSGTASASVSARIVLPKNFWFDLSFDRANELTEELETKTQGSSFTFGTNPLNEYGLDIGYDTFGVDSQYTVRETRGRVTAMPDSVFGWENPGIEIALEIRGSEFSFANTPNPIFASNNVSLSVSTFRFELGVLAWTPWSVRLFAERARLQSGFTDLDRQFAPLFIPETAISTAVTWPAEENGVSLGYSKGKWGARVMASSKQAAVTSEKTFTAMISTDYSWTRRFNTGVRFSNSQSENDPTLPTIQTTGFDMTLSF